LVGAKSVKNRDLIFEFISSCPPVLEDSAIDLIFQAYKNSLIIKRAYSVHTFQLDEFTEALSPQAASTASPLFAIHLFLQ
jgi:hypothetical protein